MVSRLKMAEILLYTLWFCLTASVAAVRADTGGWESLTTKNTIIRFQSEDDLITFDKQIDYGSGGGLSSLFGGSGGKDFREKLVQKIDGLFKRVQEILDMRKYMRRVTINVYSDNKKLQAAYREDVNGQAEHRAWYLFEKHTIYLQVNDIDEGMLAHEMAHAVIDNFLQVRPPAASAEILARYVDTHLKD
jgi:hypothetical protein